MNILEQEIEDVIWNAIQEYDHDELFRRGLPIRQNFTYVRQLSLGNYGRADMVGIYVTPSYVFEGKKRRDAYVQIYELKKDEINAQTFFQAVRYAMGLRHKIQLEQIKIFWSFEIHLIGKRLSMDGAFPFLADVFQTEVFSTPTHYP
jgi:hypothetical protein